MKRILLIEDDTAIRTGLVESLQADHYQVTTASDGETGYQMARREAFDLILLDLSLPKKNGEDVCRDLRLEGNATPIIMLTSKGQEIDRVLGLELGADDYVTKPFSLRELQARIRAVLRRGRDVAADFDEYSFGDVHLDFRRQEARRLGEELKFSSMEFKVMKFLVEHEGQVVSRNDLLENVWGHDAYPTTRTVDNFILSLRKKIESDPREPEHLVTIHGAGYKFLKAKG